MAIPFDATLESICKSALRRAGQPAPSTGMIQEAMNEAFMDVKNDIKLTAPTHPLLMTEEVQATVVGVRSQTQPTKCHKPHSVVIYDGPAEWRGTAQAGANGSITVAATMSETEGNLIGLPVFTLGGTGSLQYRHITAYNDTTKVLSVSPNWTTNPSSDTTYLICNYKREIYSTSLQVLNYDVSGWAGDSLPLYGTINGETLWFNISPDKIYPVLWNYYIDIDQLDESSALSLKILREWRSVIKAGIQNYSMETYDDTRADNTYLKYQNMLSQLRAETLTVEQTVPYDPIY